MRAVVGATDVLRLGQRRWRDGVMSNEEVSVLFKGIHSITTGLHARGVIVGDLNDGNVIFAQRASSKGATPFFIDADSMQFGAYPCTVAHERFLDPKLYGKNLAAAPAFTPESDWYAYSVLLFASLLFVHPYGGSHPSYPTQLRRAEGAYSILRPDVVYPRAAAHFSILSDDLLGWFAGVFDQGRRAAFPDAVLAPRWTRCSCGVEHARTRCPACTAAVAVPPFGGQRSAVPLVTTIAGCRIVSIFKTRGRILATAMQGGLRYAYEENGVVRREDGSRVHDGKLGPGMRVALAGNATWLANGTKLSCIVREHVTQSVTADLVHGEPAFDASTAGCFYVAGDWIMNAVTGTRMGQILEGQTWLRIGERLGFGFYRAGALTFHFLIRPGVAGVKHVALPPMDGRLIDASAVFEGSHVLFSTAVEKNGQRTNAMYLVSEDGEVIASCSGSPESRPALGHVFGKCISNGVILCATDEGLVLMKADPKTALLTESKLFAETRQFVAGGSDILAGPGGSVYLAANGEITQLSLA